MASKSFEYTDRGFTWLSQSFHANHSARPNGSGFVDRFTVGYYPMAEGTLGEFDIELTRDDRELRAQLQVFDDAWPALAHCGDLISMLAVLRGVTPLQIAELLVRLGFRDMTKREQPGTVPVPELYTIYHGSAWFDHKRALMAAPVRVDGSVEWESMCEVENIERDEIEHVRRICAMLEIDDATQRFA